MSEPSDTSARVVLKFRALGIQKVEVSLLLLHVGDSVGRRGASRAGLHRGPTVLSEDDLLAFNLGIDPIQVTLDETPGACSGSGSGTKEWQHVESDEVNGIQNGLSATVRLVTIGHIGDSDGDTEGSEVLLGRLDLGSEGACRQDMIEQGLGSELNSPSDELGLGVTVESREKAVPASLPHVITIKTELEGAKGERNVHPRYHDPIDTMRNSPRSRRRHQVRCPTQRQRRRHLNQKPSGEGSKESIKKSKRTRIHFCRTRRTDGRIDH